MEKAKSARDKHIIELNRPNRKAKRYPAKRIERRAKKYKNTNR